MKKIFFLNYIFGSFKLFPSSKIDFWPFLKVQKMEFGPKIFFREIALFDFVSFFWPGIFYIFWPTVCNFNSSIFLIQYLT